MRPRRRGAAVDREAAFVHHACVHVADFVERRLGETLDPGMDVVVAQVGIEHAERGEMARRARYDQLAHADLACHGRGMERAGAAIGDQRERRGVEPALRRDALDRVGHRRRGDLQDAFGGLDDAEAERFGKMRFDRDLGRGGVERHLAAEEAIGAEPAEQEVRVGHGRPGSRRGHSRRDREPRRRSAVRPAWRRLRRAARYCRRRCRPRKYRSSRSGSAGRCYSPRSGRSLW